MVPPMEARARRDVSCVTVASSNTLPPGSLPCPHTSILGVLGLRACAFVRVCVQTPAPRLPGHLPTAGWTRLRAAPLSHQTCGLCPLWFQPAERRCGRCRRLRPRASRRVSRGTGPCRSAVAEWSARLGLGERLRQVFTISPRHWSPLSPPQAPRTTLRAVARSAAALRSVWVPRSSGWLSPLPAGLTLCSTVSKDPAEAGAAGRGGLRNGKPRSRRRAPCPERRVGTEKR